MDDEMIEVSHSAADEGENGWAATPAYSEPPPSEEPAYAAVEQHDEQPAYQNSPFDSTVDVDHAHAAASAAAAPAYEAEQAEGQFEATQRVDESVETTDEFTLNEVDILELPPIEDGKTIEFTTSDAAGMQGGREVVSLSPELMEILVQKVVDRLSRRS
jgi:hypothetical protein